MSMSDRMTKGLVLNALYDAFRTAGRSQNAILHSDRGSQYCSYAYQEKLKVIHTACHRKEIVGITKRAHIHRSLSNIFISRDACSSHLNF